MDNRGILTPTLPEGQSLASKDDVSNTRFHDIIEMLAEHL